MSGLTQAERKLYFNACDPEVALVEEGDARYVPLDGEGGDGFVRGADWVEELASVLELTNRPVCALFTGLPGTGKTTTIHRLLHRLGGDEARFFCVYLDAAKRLDLHTPIDVPDVFITAAYELERAVLRAEGRDAEDALRDGYLTRLWLWLKTLDAEFERFETGARPGGVDPGQRGASGPAALSQLIHAPALRELLRRRVSEHMSTFLVDVREEIGRLCRRVMCTRAPDGGAWAGVVVVVDSLEKLRGSQSNFEDVLASAERLFADGADDLRLVSPDGPSDGGAPPLVHAVYTVPAALAMRQAMLKVKYLPMIKLRDRNGAEHPPGVAMARRLIRARVPDEALLRVFGEGHDAMESRLRKIILWSGGYPREIVRVLGIVVRQTHPVDDALLDRLLQQEGDTYRRIVPEVAFPWLARVAVDHVLTITDDSQRPVVDRMLASNVVLRYQNAREWFDVHPALLDLEAFRAMVIALRASRHARSPLALVVPDGG